MDHMALNAPSAASMVNRGGAMGTPRTSAPASLNPFDPPKGSTTPSAALPGGTGGQGGGGRAPRKATGHLQAPKEPSVITAPKGFKARRENLTDLLFKRKGFPMTPEFRAQIAQIDQRLEQQLLQAGYDERQIEAALAQRKATLLDQYTQAQEMNAQQLNQAGLFGSGLANKEGLALNEASFNEKAAAAQEHNELMRNVALQAQAARHGWVDEMRGAIGQRAYDVSSDPELYGALYGRRRRG